MPSESVSNDETLGEGLPSKPDDSDGISREKILGNGKAVKEVPSIPHVTSNMIPLSNILKYYSQESYKQLVNVIENLSKTKDTENDADRKKSLLSLIISLRQDFIKVYTLVKWASASKDVSKLIDLLNWIRSQDYFYDQLGFGLNELNRYSGAKLPNSDIITSLEVFSKKRPQLPSHNLLKSDPISPEKVLEVLRDLNLALRTRLALMEDIPERFVNNYQVKDGRIIFTVSNEFQVSVSVPNDRIVETQEDYAKSPFCFIDFNFLFGINPETSLITCDHQKIITRLPENAFKNLESVANSTLMQQGLQGLYDLLHKYSISFKLYLIYKQLKDLSTNSKWRNNIKYRYENGKFLLIINYWSMHYLSRSWKSFIELGVDKSYNLNYRWFKNGRYELADLIPILPNNNKDQKNPEMCLNSTESADEFDDQYEKEDLSIDSILTKIVNHHSEILMSNVYNTLKDKLSDVDGDLCYLVTPHQLYLKLTPTKSALFAINPLSGYFYFLDPSPIQNQITKRINLVPQGSRNKSIIPEDDMIKNCIQNLIHLKLEVFGKEIMNQLATSGWIKNNIIKLSDYETTKLVNFLEDPKLGSSDESHLFFYRCKNWPSSWFLVNSVSGLNFETYWWVARIKSVKGEWKIQWVQRLKFETEIDMVETSPSLDYEFFFSLSGLCSNMIIDHMILEELQERNVRFIKNGFKKKSKQILEKFGLDNESSNVPDNESSGSAYESMIVIFNNNNLFPVENSSTSMFLSVKLINLSISTQMRLKLFGKLRGLPESLSDNSDANLHISKNLDYFEITDSVNLSHKISNPNTADTNLLDILFSKLKKLSELTRIINKLSDGRNKIVVNSINKIQVNLDNEFDALEVKLPEDNEKLQLICGKKKCDQHNSLIDNLNQYLSTSDLPEEDMIVGVIKYLNEVSPLIKAVDAVKSFLSEHETLKLGNGLSKLNFDVAVQSLNLMQFIYHLNFSSAGTKKILKDKVVVNLSFKQSKFSQANKLLIKLSLKDNLNSKNLKHKQLFEQIFKTINQFEVGPNTSFIKLNYDFLIDSAPLDKLMVAITKCFLHYINDNVN